MIISGKEGFVKDFFGAGVNGTEKTASQKGQFGDVLKQLTSMVDKRELDRAKETVRGNRNVPYSYMARDGMIQYNGVTFICDPKRNALCLGDVSNPKKVLNIPLSGGGVLKVNRNNLGDLAQAIGMFSPEDANNIMRAIAEDTHCRRKLNEIEELKQDIPTEDEDNSEEE